MLSNRCIQFWTLRRLPWCVNNANKYGWHQPRPASPSATMLFPTPAVCCVGWLPPAAVCCWKNNRCCSNEGQRETISGSRSDSQSASNPAVLEWSFLKDANNIMSNTHTKIQINIKLAIHIKWWRCHILTFIERNRIACELLRVVADVWYCISHCFPSWQKTSNL